MTILESILLAASLCADCFAVSLCSSVSLKQTSLRSVSLVALSFALIQTVLLVLGWSFGAMLMGIVEKTSKIIGFCLLLYVGGGMLREGIKGEQECRNLNGFKNIVIGGVATSIDAMSLGGFLSMNAVSFKAAIPLIISVFTITLLSVATGIYSGKALGTKFGRWAEIVGGAVLLGIGIGILI